MYKETYNEFLLVLPNGDCIGFNDIESAKSYINRFYEDLIKEKIHEEGDNDITENSAGSDARINICTDYGVENGNFQLYSIDDVIDKVNESTIFEEEKSYIIENLYEAEIDFNMYDSNLDELMSDIEPIEIMESYGEMD